MWLWILELRKAWLKLQTLSGAEQGKTVNNVGQVLRLSVRMLR